MTERRGDQGFSVAPQRIDDAGPGGRGRLGGRRRNLGVVAVVVGAAAIIAVSWLGPRLSTPPHFDVAYFATPSPDPAVPPSPTPGVTFIADGFATPLPEITRPDGPVPVGKVGLLSDRFRVVDLATGDIVTGPQAAPGRDAVFRSPGGGWTCICIDDGALTGGDALSVRLTRIDPDGAPISTTGLASWSLTGSETGHSEVTTDVDVFGGGHRGLLAVGTRNGGPWTIAVAAIDLDAGQAADEVRLGSIAAVAPTPSPTPTPSPGEPGFEGSQDVYLDGPHVRVAPNGRVAFVWADVERVGSDGEGTFETRAWRVALDADGSVGAVTEAKGLLDMPPYCSGGGFAAADRFAWLCPSFNASDAFDGTWQLATMDLDGKPMGKTLIRVVDPSFYLEGMFDRANGQIFAWDGSGLTIRRFDARTLAMQSVTFDPLVGESAGLPPGGGTEGPDWHHADSATGGVSGLLAGSLEGDRLFALGFDNARTDIGGPASRGVFVIDRRTLALLDRWAPAAAYVSLTALPGGYVAAAGLPGIKEDGQPALWESSLTIHDASDGRILVRFGQLGSDNPPLVVDR